MTNYILILPFVEKTLSDINENKSLLGFCELMFIYPHIESVDKIVYMLFYRKIFYKLDIKLQRDFQISCEVFQT